MRFSMEQVEAFVLTAEHGSFSAAARALGRTQSTISSAISYLEISLGTELFDRSTRVPSLTEAGRTLLLEARALYDRAVTFERHGDALADEQAASITLAEGSPHEHSMQMLREFTQDSPRN